MAMAMAMRIKMVKPLSSSPTWAKMAAKAQVKQLSHTQLMSLLLECLPKLDVMATVTDASLVKTHAGRYLTHRVSTGWPDITGVTGISYKNPGRAFLIEVKRDSQNCKSKIQEAQVRTADALEKAGALVIREARSLEDVLSILEKERK